MSFSVQWNKPEIKSQFDWQLCQEVNVLNEAGEVIAKAEIELLTLNRHRDALKSYDLLAEVGDGQDWELLLNLFFKGQNVNGETAELIAAQTDAKKAQTHILLEALSVLPEYRGQGLARLLLQNIATKYPKAQSLSVLSMPMALFLDPQDCEDETSQAYYQALNLSEDHTSLDTLSSCFTKLGFKGLSVDESLLTVQLPYELFMINPAQL